MSIRRGRRAKAVTAAAYRVNQIWTLQFPAKAADVLMDRSVADGTFGSHGGFNQFASRKDSVWSAEKTLHQAKFGRSKGNFLIFQKSSVPNEVHAQSAENELHVLNSRAGVHGKDLLIPKP